MKMNKWFLAVGLLAAGLVLMVCGKAFALPAYNQGVMDYQNLALTNYETWSNFILITPITGPWLSALKEQKRWRGSGSYSIANVAVVYGDSVQYRFTIINETQAGAITASDTAINVYVTDTRTFTECHLSGDSAIIVLTTTATGDSATGPNSVTTFVGGSTATVTTLEYKTWANSQTVGNWVSVGSISELAGSITNTSGNLFGIRWRVDQIPPSSIAGAVYLQFTVKIVD